MFIFIKKLMAVLLSLIVIPTSVGQPLSTALAPKRFAVTVDDGTKAILDEIKNNSQLDIEKIITNLPDLNTPAKIANAVIPIDTEEFRNQMYARRDAANAEGNQAAAFFYYLVGSYFSVFESCHIVFEENADSGYYEFVLEIQYADGYSERLYTGTLYDPETGEFYGHNGKGLTDLGFNFDMKNMVVYAVLNCWMRDFGFCAEYDIFCYLTPFFQYHTRRFKFDYAGKEWMIQIWKGRYVVANGAEVGIYNRDPIKAGSYYNCAGDEDMLPMSLSVYHGDELLLNREEQTHWWINGFRLSQNVYSAKDLTIRFTIEMKDAEMLKAFTEAVNNNAYHDVTYTVDGLTVYLAW